MQNIHFFCFFIVGMISYAQTYFVTIWNTEIEDVGNATIVLPITDDGAYDVDIGNNGTFEMTNLTGTQTITFTSAGTHIIAVKPSDTNTNSQLRISHQATDSTPKKLMSIDKWGDIIWTSMANAFRGCSNMTISENAEVPNLAIVTDMSFMFFGATNFNSDLSGWDVSNVTNMRRAFSSATNFNGDISSWNVSKVANMRRTFSNTISFNRDVSNWNVSNATKMDYMFFKATNFNSNLSTWDISNVTDMIDMLTNARSFSTENYDALLTGWSKLTLQNDVIFGAPPTIYCAGKDGRDILTDTYNWDISGDIDGGCSTTSTEEEFLSNAKIYPNPTNNKINIESPFKIDKLELYNILGAKIFSISKTNTLDLASLKQGIYILKVFSDDRVVGKKVIKD